MDILWHLTVISEGILTELWNKYFSANLVGIWIKHQKINRNIKKRPPNRISAWTDGGMLLTWLPTPSLPSSHSSKPLLASFIFVSLFCVISRDVLSSSLLFSSPQSPQKVVIVTITQSQQGCHIHLSRVRNTELITRVGSSEIHTEINCQTGQCNQPSLTDQTK